MAGGRGQQWSKAWLAAAAFAVVGAARAAPGSNDNDPDLSAEDLLKITEPLLTSIAEEEARNGPYSADLVALLTSLGLTYQENGEDVLAVTVLDINRQPVVGRTVYVTSSRNVGDVITPTSSPVTNGNGQAYFSVRGTQMGQATFTVTVDGIALQPVFATFNP